MIKQNKPLVSIICNTYNHEPYIRQCLEGFVMQKTDFVFEVLIHDDASTDKTADIIREYEIKYPEIIKPIYQTENQYSKNTGIMKTFQYPRVKGKYIALCEGDDYWIDPLKLQKQVDFLEQNPEYGLICTDVNFYYQNSNRFQCNYFSYKKYPIKYTFDDFLKNAWFIAPCTWLFRSEFVVNRKSNHNFVVGDLPLLLDISANSNVCFWGDTTSVYRVLKDSASHGKSYKQQIDFQKGILYIQKYYLDKYDRTELKNNIIRNYYKVMMKISLKENDVINTVIYASCYLIYCFRR